MSVFNVLKTIIIMSLIDVVVRTGRPEFKIEERGGHTVIHLTSEPENEEANRELMREMSKIYKTVKIVRGFHSKHKTLQIEEY